MTQNTDTKDYMMIMDYANNGDLHKYLQNNFTNILWVEKLYILRYISDGYLYFIIPLNKIMFIKY